MKPPIRLLKISVFARTDEAMIGALHECIHALETGYYIRESSYPSRTIDMGVEEVPEIDIG